MSLIDPTCPTGCSSNLPVLDFDNCSPEVYFGEIEKVYLASLNAAVISNWTTSTDWLARIDNTDTADANTIKELTVSADLPAGAYDVLEISNRRKVLTPTTYTIPITIDDLSDDNYDFMRWTECNVTVKMWFATHDHLYGGDEGITAQIMLKPVIERGNKSMQKIEGTITWEAKYSPERCLNPLT